MSIIISFVHVPLNPRNCSIILIPNISLILYHLDLGILNYRHERLMDSIGPCIIPRSIIFTEVTSPEYIHHNKK